MRIMGLLVVVCVAALPACGQKGPLVLPDAQHPHKRIGIGKPAAPAGPPSTSPPAPATAPNDAPASDAAADDNAKAPAAPPSPQP